MGQIRKDKTEQESIFEYEQNKKKFKQQIFEIYGIDPKVKNADKVREIKIISDYYDDNWKYQNLSNMVVNFRRAV